MQASPAKYNLAFPMACGAFYMVGETVARPGGALSGTVLNWGDAYAGVSSRVLSLR